MFQYQCTLQMPKYDLINECQSVIIRYSIFNIKYSMALNINQILMINYVLKNISFYKINTLEKEIKFKNHLATYQIVYFTMN